MCRPCHSAVHRTYTNKELASDYSTLEELLAVRRLLGVEIVGAKSVEHNMVVPFEVVCWSQPPQILDPRGGCREWRELGVESVGAWCWPPVTTAVGKGCRQ